MKSNSAFAFSLGAWALALFPAAAATRGPSAAEVSAMLRAEGPKATIDWLWADERRADAVSYRIAGGNPTWLRLAVALRPGADAAAAEGLDIAVSQALAHNPAGVLRIAVPTFPLKSTCGDNRIEPSPAEVRLFRGQALAALRSLRAPELRSARDVCLAIFRKDNPS
ncbi:MAG TPA: hypothetical protein VHV27_02245 [Phenylobacterium sp.]|jgi:hypothetical protein|nr:hypothetical protein [Phenylobacterium sp.]